MTRLPIIHPESAYATAVTIAAGELHLEPVRILDGRWCIRRNGRLIPVEPGDVDAFVLPRGTVDDGHGEWKRLSRWLADHDLVVPGDRDTIAAALKAGHWGPHRVAVERYRGRGSDMGLAKTIARGLAA